MSLNEQLLTSLNAFREQYEFTFKKPLPQLDVTLTMHPDLLRQLRDEIDAVRMEQHTRDFDRYAPFFAEPPPLPTFDLPTNIYGATIQRSPEHPQNAITFACDGLVLTYDMIGYG